jgi:hypothetical protein
MSAQLLAGEKGGRDGSLQNIFNPSVNREAFGAVEQIIDHLLTVSDKAAGQIIRQ